MNYWKPSQHILSISAYNKAENSSLCSCYRRFQRNNYLSFLYKSSVRFKQNIISDYEMLYIIKRAIVLFKDKRREEYDYFTTQDTATKWDRKNRFPSRFQGLHYPLCPSWHNDLGESTFLKLVFKYSPIYKVLRVKTLTPRILVPNLIV